jgi:hypothetical protein
MADDALDNIVANDKQHPDRPFGHTGAALERVLASGASKADVALVMRSAAYQAVFSTLYALGDPGVDDGNVFMLHEELLTADPSGMEGRPGSAGITSGSD